MPNDSPQKKEAIKFLGQTFVYPATVWATTAVFCVCTAIVLIVRFVLYAPMENVKAVRGFFTATEFPASGKPTMFDSVRVEFWTPSTNTWSYLGNNVPTKDQWETNVTEMRLREFGERLRADDEVEGYRRYEVVGHGHTTFKPGWWWTMRVKQGYSVEKLAQTYRTFWGADKAYIEVIESQGRYQR